MNFFLFHLDYYYLILVVPAMILALIAQIGVKRAYLKYAQVRVMSGMTGADAAMNVLRHYGLMDVRIEHVAGNLTDHYDPRANVIRLSDGVYGSASVAAIGVACHEAGHAVQHAKGYLPIKIRNAILLVCNLGSKLGIPLAVAGLIFGADLLVNVGLLLYSLVVIFQLATLPVEFNASRRAIRVIDDTGMLSQDEIPGAQSVLRAAAMTYVASLVVSLANLLRLLAIFAGRRDD
uniref:zinc metallopeptidase n=1 Tax=Candidatus Fimivicinus sp. TaxID=3056640 RepID=UPI003FEE1A31